MLQMHESRFLNSNLFKTFKMSLKLKKIVWITIILFVITVIFDTFWSFNHVILFINYAKSNQKLGFVFYNHEFAITMIVITEVDYISNFSKNYFFDSSNAVLGMAFTPDPLEKVIAFCTAETNFVLHSKQNKNKDSRKSSLNV